MEDSETARLLANVLQGMLEEHGVPVSRNNNLVLLEETGTTMVLRLLQDNTPGDILLQLGAFEPDGTSLFDEWAGLGGDLQSAIHDGMVAFSHNILHTVLASHAGVLETDRAAHEVVTVAGQEWDLYNSGWLTRASSEGHLQPPPIWESLRAMLPQLLTGSMHYGRLYISVFNGRRTHEALLNKADHGGLGSLLSQVTLNHSETGYASVRLFFVARRRTGNQPAHSRESACEV